MKHQNDNSPLWAIPASVPDTDTPIAFDPTKPSQPPTPQEQAEWDLNRTLLLACPREQGQPLPRRDLAAKYLARGMDPQDAAALLRRRARMGVIPGAPG